MLCAAATKEHTMRAMFMTGGGAGGVLKVLFALCMVAGLGACGHHKTSDAVGVGLGVSLTAPAGSSVVEAGSTIEIDAVVSNDPSNKGVTWTLTGVGSAQSSDTTKYVYLAPTPVTGAITVTLTATSITDPTQIASVTLTVNGTPVIPAPVLFPANLNIVYAAYFTVEGGLAPFTWTVKSGTLPAGLTLDGSTSATTALSGIPTSLGTTTFTLEVTDSNSAVADVTATLVVNPQTACVLLGHFGYLFTGFRAGQPVVRAGSLNIASDGTITGIHDYKDQVVTRIGETLTDGTCTTSTQNRGTIRIVTNSGVESFDFGTISTLSAGQLQENDGTPIVGGGQYFIQNTATFTQASMAGDYGFGLVGIDGNQRRLAIVGRLSIDATGAVSNGVADTNATTPLAAATLSGSFTAADANGRGTATLQVGSVALPVAYYIIDANTVYVVSNDTSTKTLRVAGRMTRQTGAGTLSASALAGQSVLSMWGSSIVGGLPTATVSAGLFSTATATTLNLGLDVTDRGAALVHTEYPTSPFTVTANGRGTLSIGSGATARQFVLYVTGTGNGYLIEPTSDVGNFGIFDQQVGAPFSDFLSSYYVGGTVFATSTSPISLVPQILLQEGALSGNVTGSYAIDPATGRAIATVSRNILGGSGLVLYIVSTNKIVVLGDGVNSVNGSLAWLQGY